MLFVVYNQLFIYYIHFQLIIFSVFLTILHNNSTSKNVVIVEIFVQKKSILLLRGL